MPRRLRSAVIAAALAPTLVLAPAPQSASAVAAAPMDAAFAAYHAGAKADAFAIWSSVVDGPDAPAAQANAGRMLIHGDGVPADGARGRAVLTAAAKLGGVAAKRLLGEALVDGAGGPADVAKGLDWLAQAAKAGDADASFRLGLLRDRGDVAPRDLTAARGHYHAAAEAGHADGAFNYAAMVERGDGGVRRPHEARRWYARAAAAGHAGAAYNLAILYESGALGAPALGDARRWYAVAAKGGVSQAARRRAILLADAKAPTAAPIDGGWTIRLAAFRERAAADRGRAKIAAALSDVFAETDLAIREAFAPGVGRVHRVVAGPLPNRAAANALCAALRDRGADCLPGAPPNAPPNTPTNQPQPSIHRKGG